MATSIAAAPISMEALVFTLTVAIIAAVLAYFMSKSTTRATLKL